MIWNLCIISCFHNVVVNLISCLKLVLHLVLKWFLCVSIDAICQSTKARRVIILNVLISVFIVFDRFRTEFFFIKGSLASLSMNIIFIKIQLNRLMNKIQMIFIFVQLNEDVPQ
jgi:hypothetical protein